MFCVIKDALWFEREQPHQVRGHQTFPADDLCQLLLTDLSPICVATFFDQGVFRQARMAITIEVVFPHSKGFMD